MPIGHEDETIVVNYYPSGVTALLAEEFVAEQLARGATDDEVKAKMPTGWLNVSKNEDLELEEVA